MTYPNIHKAVTGIRVKKGVHAQNSFTAPLYSLFQKLVEQSGRSGFSVHIIRESFSAVVAAVLASCDHSHLALPRIQRIDKVMPSRFQPLRRRGID
jgi:hypothetical protein